MKKRILNIAILVVVLALCVVFFLVTCDRGGDGAGNGSTYKVDFTTYVDATVPSQNVAKDGYATEPTVTLARAGYTFDGWYDGDKKWDFKADKVTKDTTLTAKWTKYLSFVDAKDESGGVWVAGCDFDVENVVIPSEYNGKKVTGIHWAFTARDKVKTVVIPDTVTYISDYAFNNCKSIETIFIPKSVVTINEAAFSLCDNLKEIKCEAAQKPAGWHDRFNLTSATVTYGAK